MKAVAFSPDMRFVLSASGDETVRLWDVDTGKEVFQSKEMSQSMESVSFSSDGRYALVGGCYTRWDKSMEKLPRRTLKMLNPKTGGEVHIFPTGSTYDAVFSSDGRHVLSAGSDGKVRLWEVATGREIRVFVGHSGPVRSVKFSPDSRFAISASQDKSIKLWKLWDDGEVPPPPSPVPLQIKNDTQREDDDKRADDLARVVAERVKVLQAFGEFQKSFLASLAKRDYAGAQQQAQQASDNPLFESLKERAVAFGEVATRLDKFWSSLSVTLAALKGKPVTVQSETGVVSGVTKVNLELEKSVTGGTAIAEIPISSLTPDEIAALVAQAKPNDKDTLLDLAWVFFISGKQSEANARLGAAEKAGVDVKVSRELMDALTARTAELEAQQVLDQLRALVASKQWSVARLSLQMLQSRYGQTNVTQSAAREIAELNGKISEEEAAVAAAIEASKQRASDMVAAAALRRKVRSLADDIGNTDDRLVMSAAEELRKIGPPAIPHLKEYMQEIKGDPMKSMMYGRMDSLIGTLMRRNNAPRP